MEFKHKIFEGLKNTPEGWRFCNCWKKAAKGGGNQYDSPYTLEQVLELDGDGVGVLLGRHSTAVINGKKYGLGTIDADGTDWEINFKHHVGVHPNSLPITVAVASGKKDRKQMFFWIPEEYLDVLKRKDIKLENCGNFELRIGNNYSMVAGAHPETDGYFWVNSPAQFDIAIAPLWLLEYWEEICQKKKSKFIQRRIRRTREQLIHDSSRIERYLERYYSPANNYSDYDSWMRVLMALHHLSLEWEECTGVQDKHLPDAHSWSYEMSNYDAQELENKWDSFSKDLDDEGVVTIASFFGDAKKHPNWIKDEVRFQGDKKEPTKRKRSELLKDLLQHAKNKDLDTFYEDFAEYEHRYKRKPSLINMDLLQELRDSYSPRAYKVGEVDMSKVKDLEYILEGFLVRGEVHQIFAGAGMGKTSLLAGMVKAGFQGVGFLNKTQCPRDKFRTLWIACDGGSSRFKSVYQDMGLNPEMVDVWGGDIQQGLTNWKWTIPNLVLLIEKLSDENSNYGMIVFDSLKGMLANTGFAYTDNEHSDSINQFLREIVAEPFGLACVLINHLSNDGKAGSGAKRWGETVAVNAEIKPVILLDASPEDGGQGAGMKEDNSLRKLCMWKNPIDGRSFLEYSIENGDCVPNTKVLLGGKCYEQMLKAVQKYNMETGQRVFHITEIKQLLPHYSEGQVQRTAKEHLKGRNGIFKPQKSASGKVVPATYELKSLYVLDKVE